MKIVTLSNHTGDQLRLAREARQQQNEARQSEFQAAQKAHDSERLRRDYEARLAWRAGHYGRCAASWLRARLHRWAKRPTPPSMLKASDLEKRWEAGHEGETRVITELSRQLDDSWITLVGYCNQKGEADLLLVGPPGILGIEIKNVVGVINCQGDHWTRDIYDRHGRCVQSAKPIRDGGGRGPSRQINEVCASLRHHFNQVHQAISVRTAVVFPHGKAQIGTLDSLTVSYAGPLHQLDVASLFPNSDSVASVYDANTLVRVIEADHANHARRRARNSGGSRPRDNQTIAAHIPVTSAPRHTLSQPYQPLEGNSAPNQTLHGIPLATVFEQAHLAKLGASFADFCVSPNETLRKYGQYDAVAILKSGNRPLLPAQVHLRQRWDSHAHARRTIELDEPREHRDPIACKLPSLLARSPAPASRLQTEVRRAMPHLSPSNDMFAWSFNLIRNDGRIGLSRK